MLVYQRVPSFDPSPHVAVLSSSAAAAARRFCCSSAWTWRCFEKKNAVLKIWFPSQISIYDTYIHTCMHACITLHYITLHYITLHYIHTYHSIPFHSIPFHSIPLHTYIHTLHTYITYIHTQINQYN